MTTRRRRSTTSLMALLVFLGLVFIVSFLAVFLALWMTGMAHAAEGSNGRDPRKCGLVLASRAERGHRLGFRVVRLPSNCREVAWPKGYGGKLGPYGAEIWRNNYAERLAWALDTPTERIIDQPPLIVSAGLDPTKVLDDLRFRLAKNELELKLHKSEQALRRVRR